MVHLYKKLIDTFGDEWLGFEPETLEVALKEKWGSYSDSLITKVMALQAFLLTDAVYNDCFIFQKWILLLNDYPVNWNQMQELSVLDILYGIEQMEEIRPRDVFSDEVLEYIADIFQDNGVTEFTEGVFKPEEVTYMQRYLDGEER